MFRITGWNVLKGSLFARKTYEQTKVFDTPNVDTVTVTERTTFDLRHTP
jgi:hypothetical protein